MHETIVTNVHGVCPSACLSRMHRMTLHSEADLRLGLTVRGQSVQPLSNHFDYLLNTHLHCPGKKYHERHG